MKISELQAKKISELRELARELGLTGYSTLRKQDLIYRILEAQAEAEAGRPNGAARRAATTQESTDMAPKEEVAETVSEDAGDETVEAEAPAAETQAEATREDRRAWRERRGRRGRVDMRYADWDERRRRVYEGRPAYMANYDPARPSWRA